MQNSLCVEDDSSKVGSRLSKFNSSDAVTEPPVRKRDVKVQRKRVEDKEISALRTEELRQDLMNRLRCSGGRSGKRFGILSSLARKTESLEADRQFKEEAKAMTARLLHRMKEAVLADHKAIENGNAALRRFQMLDDLVELLRKKHIQTSFLSMQGINFLEAWLERNPDNSHPPLQVVESVLMVLDMLPVTQDVLSDSNIGRLLATDYAQSGNATEPLPAEIVSASTKLLQKWQTVVFKLSYEYDNEGQHEVKQRDLRKRLEVLRDLDVGDKRDDRQQREDDLIKKTPNGFVLHKQNFDWLEKPEASIDPNAMRHQSDFRATLKSLRPKQVKK